MWSIALQNLLIFIKKLKGFSCHTISRVFVTGLKGATLTDVAQDCHNPENKINESSANTFPPDCRQNNGFYYGDRHKHESLKVSFAVVPLRCTRTSFLIQFIYETHADLHSVC